MKIDWWTLGIEAVNVAVLVWLLARFFWRPVAAMIAQRRTAAAKELADATAKRAEADKALAEIAGTRAGLAKERETMLAAAASDADKERAARLAKTAKEIEALRVAAEAAIAKEKEAAASTWREESTASACTSCAAAATPATSCAARAAASDDAVTCCAISRLVLVSSPAVPRMRSPAWVKALTTSSMALRKLPVKKWRPA